MQARLLIYVESPSDAGRWRRNLAGELPHFLTTSPSGLRAALQTSTPDVLFLVASSTGGVELMQTFRPLYPELRVVVVLGELRPEWLQRAWREGASDVLSSAATPDEVKHTLSRLLTCAVTAPRQPAAAPAAQLMTGGSRAMREIAVYGAKVAQSDCAVLITGETGTGKELAAEFFHSHSRRARGPLVAVNCAALPDQLLESELFGHRKGAFTGADRDRPGAFAAAAGGTIFLDEIGEMEIGAQSKLLRVLEKRTIRPLGTDAEVPVDVRVIAATNQDPERLVREKRFREDLFFRLNVARIELPPLRARREDIPVLVSSLMARCAQRLGVAETRFDACVMDRLVHFDWPGNVRELRNFVEVVLAGQPGPVTRFADLPFAWRDQLRMVTNRGENERSRVLEALTCARGNKSEAARMLACSRMTLYRKMVEYGIAKSGAA